MGEETLHSLENQYGETIDAETWAFIKETETFYPEDTIDESIENQRLIYDRLCKAFHKGYPSGIIAEDLAIEAKGRAIPIRYYRFGELKSNTSIIYFHGGGFVAGGLDSHDDICAEICAETGFDVVSVDYRLSPENVYPACFDDALASFKHLVSGGDQKIILVGDSAGGNLAAAVSEATKNEPVKPIGQVLIYPGLGSKTDFGSYIRHQNAPMLTKKDVDFYHQIRTGGISYDNDPRLTPLTATDVSQIPPTVIFSAEIDPLCDDGELYVQRLNEANVKARWVCETGLVHGFLRARNTVGRAKASFLRILQAIQTLGT